LPPFSMNGLLLWIHMYPGPLSPITTTVFGLNIRSSRCPGTAIWFEPLFNAETQRTQRTYTKKSLCPLRLCVYWRVLVVADHYASVDGEGAVGVGEHG
jgi:hypothetical protein